ncbi:Vegetative incompatibility protein HET-E-1 [Ceratobasidium sp. AG-Ba]|nr:Vegetative incompatibility protein HET-E-1 [Ceratobasidium sp. AG-Ba]
MTSKSPKHTRIHQINNQTPSQDTEHVTLHDPSSTAAPGDHSLNQPSTGAYNQNPQQNPKKSATSKLKASLHILKKSTHLVPALGSAVDVLVDCFDHMTLAAETEREFEEITSHISSIILSLEGHRLAFSSERLSQAIDKAVSDLKEAAERANTSHWHTGGKRRLDTARGTEELTACYRRLDLSLWCFQASLSQPSPAQPIFQVLTFV